MKIKFFEKNLIIVISSPSGTGKTSVCREILDRDKKIKLSVSYTTRTPRDNEKDGEDYNFVSKEFFENEIKQNNLLEYAKVFENYYGSSYAQVEKLLLNDFDVLFDIDWQGAKQITKTNISNLVTIFLIPPSKLDVFNRLKKRSLLTGDDLKSIEKRMSEFENEMSHKDEYNYVIKNENLGKCVSQVEEIIRKERLKLI